MSIHFSNPTRVQIWRTGILSQTQRLSSIFRRDALIHYRQVMIHPYGRFPKWFLSLFSILLLFLTGCGRYSMHEIRIAFAEGKFDEALTHLDKASSKTALPYLFERGLLAHYGDHFEESNQALERAELLAEDLYTKSISREVAALLTSDNVRPYPGTRYERLLVHYYRALNYVYMNLPDDALVECRRAGQLLQYYADEDPTYNFAGAGVLRLPFGASCTSGQETGMMPTLPIVGRRRGINVMKSNLAFHPLKTSDTRSFGSRGCWDSMKRRNAMHSFMVSRLCPLPVQANSSSYMKVVSSHRKPKKICSSRSSRQIDSCTKRKTKKRTRTKRKSGNSLMRLWVARTSSMMK